VTALYRRYRPETFHEIIGQSHVTNPLRHVLTSKRSHHAYLFSGPRGCGKTTSARILARCLNCAQGPTDSPCGVCPSCVELARDGGGSLDVVEIDAASHNGVDDARELRERAVFAPARDRYKIFILDEAHMVTMQGFNALLKIVEEPPEHVKFIFATTEPEKVLGTIRSRTHHYPFHLVAPAELVSYLESVVANEGVVVEQGVLPLVVLSGGGSVRDSLSILDQLIAGSAGNSVSLREARALLGYTPHGLLDQILNSLAEGHSERVFRGLDEVLQTGQDPRRFTEELLSHLRDMIVTQATGKAGIDLFPGASGSDIERWLEQSSWFSPVVLASLADAVSNALLEMSGVTSPKLQLELLMAQLLAMTQTSSGTGMADESSEVKVQPAPAPPSEHRGSKNYSGTSGSQERESEPGGGHSEPPGPVNFTGKPLSLDLIRAVWADVIGVLADHKRSLWVALAETQPIALEDDILTIGFVRKSDAEVLKKPQGPGSPTPNADLLRDALMEKIGHRVRFTVGLLERPTSPFPAQVAEASDWPEKSYALQSEAQDELIEATEHNGETVSDESSVAQAHGLVNETATAPIATRGEPVVRQLLGGELVGEEILGEMSDKGEADV
jgi:DNA polymerase-3 subunit gamma/tau